jgi:hypothetical protein
MAHLKTGEVNMTNTKHLVLAVDPGKATGLSVFSFVKGEEPEMLDAFEAQFDTFAPWIRQWISTRDKYDEFHVVCERFTINAQTVKNSQAPFSLEEIGVLKQIMLDEGIDPDTLKMQSPADAKAMWDNPKLKKLGYWHKGGEGHALDSIRHGLLYLIKLGWNPLNRLRD